MFEKPATPTGTPGTVGHEGHYWSGFLEFRHDWQEIWEFKA
jgi:hypothetical protein